MFIRTLALAIACTGGAFAADFSPLMDVAKETWPTKRHIGVVCDYRTSASAVQELAEAAGPETRITVVDARTEEDLASSQQYLLQKKADYVVLLPQDRLVWDGSFAATRLIGQLAHKGIPTVATTPKAIAQGAVFSVGDDTNGELLVTHKLIGTIECILPQKGTFVRTLTRRAAATIEVAGRNL